MKNILKFLSLFIIIIATFFTCVACDDSYIGDDEENNDNSYTLDYTNAEMLEEALNSGVSANGKYICFQVTEYHPESFYGYNCWAGEHLNCISENDVNAVEGDYIIGRITEEPYSSFGSWKIYYKFIELKKNFDDPNKEDENLQLKENEVKTPNSASYYYGKNYKDVINELQNAGFNNIKTEVLYDVVLGLFTTAEDVETVSINGKTDFKKNAIFEKDAQIVVTYHDWWDNEPNEDDLEIMDENGIFAPISSKDAKGLNYEGVKNQFINAGFTNVKYSNVTGYDREESIDSVLYIEINYSQEYKTNLKLKKDVKVVIYKYIGTYNEDNCEDLKLLLNEKDPSYSDVSTFASKYKNEYIEFDGCVWAINNTDGYDYVYDFLLGSKDFDMNHAYGPSLKFSNEYLGFETYKVGQNVHVVARVGSFDYERGLLKLSLVHMEKRTANENVNKPNNEVDSYTKLKDCIVDNGEFNTLVENNYAFEIDNGTLNETLYILIGLYDNIGKELRLMLFYKDFESDYYCSMYLILGKEISANYEWLFIDKNDATMSGSISPKTFTRNSEVLLCDYSNLALLEQSTYNELAVNSMILLLNATTNAFNEGTIPVNIKALGFSNF